MERRVYRNPPIVEAICEMRFLPSQVVDFTAPAKTYEKLKATYSGKPRSQQITTTMFRPSEQGQVEIREETSRVIFPSADEKFLLGLGPNLLSVHSLRPYCGWETFRQKIDEALQAYITVCPEDLSRVGLRYLNRITMPMTEDVGAFLTTNPHGIPGLNLKIGSFLHRTEAALPDSPLKLTLTMATVNPEQPDTHTILVDIDVFHQPKQGVLPKEQGLDRIDEMRQLEREVFESLITDRAREYFDA